MYSWLLVARALWFASLCYTNGAIVPPHRHRSRLPGLPELVVGAHYLGLFLQAQAQQYFVAAAVVYFFLFETKSLSLENCDKMYSDAHVNAPNSRKWVPLGYISRNDRDDSHWKKQSSALDSEAGGGPHSMGEKGGEDKTVDISPERGDVVTSRAS